MPWYYFLVQFLAGALVLNALPHLAAGTQGQKFQSPFAKPPGIGESSALVNVWWGASNLFGGAALLARFTPSSYVGWIVVAVGMLAIGSQLALHFGKVRHGA